MKTTKILFFILAASQATTGFSASLSDVVEKYRNSVIYVKVEKAIETTGAVTEIHGTGFVVNDRGFVITAAHVVSGGAGIQVDIRGAEGSREGYLESMEVIYESSNLDVAVLKFRNTARRRQPIPMGDPWKVKDSDTVYALGFPGKEEWFHTEGKLSGQGPKGSWNTTLTLNPGMSGGPILNSDGKVVAMAWGGVPTEGIVGINRVLPINLLSDPLQVAGALLEGSSSASPMPTPAPTQPIEVSYKFEEVQNTLGGLKSATKNYGRVFQASPGFRIMDYRYIPKSANHAGQPNITLSPDGKTLSISFTLTSGPVFDQWRGWLDAELVTRQTRE